MEKKNIVVLFGGQSSEHVVSCMSVQNVAANIDQEKYNVILVGITEDGHWLKVDSLAQIKDDTWREAKAGAVLSPDAKEKCLIVTENGKFEKVPVDVVFPVLHGLYGEDGTVQGILELAKIPYVGCGVLASAVSMDKLSTKRMVNGLGICQAAYVPVLKEELKDIDAVVAKIEKEIPYPVFVKPSNAGSSRGVTRADNREELIAGLKATIAAGAKAMVFGDMNYYWIADREGRKFQRLNELYAPTGQVGFLASQRVDGKLILPEAVKVLQMKAA